MCEYSQGGPHVALRQDGGGEAEAVRGGRALCHRHRQRLAGGRRGDQRAHQGGQLLLNILYQREEEVVTGSSY